VICITYTITAKELNILSELINLDEALGRLGGNLALYKKLLGRFLENTYIDEINKQLDAGDTETAKGTVHTLKGVSANLSLTDVNACSIAIESNLKNGEDYSDSLKALCDAVAATVVAINEL